MPTHSAGVLNIYKNVIALNKFGFKAYIVHFSKQFEKIKWAKFGKDLPFLKFYYLDQLFVINDKGQFMKSNKEYGSDDVFVVPEGFPMFFPMFKQQFKFNCKMVLYAQGWSYIIPSLLQVFNNQIPSLQQIGVDYVVAISDETKKYVMDCFSFPEESISVIDNYIDPNLFNLNLGKESVDVAEENVDGDLTIVSKEIDIEKKNTICFMPRRGVEMWYQIILLLANSTQKINGWEIKPLVNMTQEQVAEELKRSKIFLHYTDGEGFGYPPLEAMMTGNIIVGNSGLGSDAFLGDYPYWILPKDLKNPYHWVNAIEKAISMLNEINYVEIEELNKKYVEKYSINNYLKKLNETYKKIVGE
jgi:glycosyltransferase involved in cell wall biosynthesis